MIPEFAERCRHALWDDIDTEQEYPAVRPLLAHYSSLEVLEKIMRSNELWMSHPLLMNDRDEMRWGLDAGRARLAASFKMLSACGTSERFHHLVQEFDFARAQYYSFTELLTFVVCFSKHDPADNDGRLSMWRGYGANGSGVALVLDTSKIDPAPVEGSPFILSRIVYLTNDQRRQWIDGVLNKLANLIREGNPTQDDLRWASRLFLERLKVFNLFTKHKGFEEEQEWRFAYLGERDIDRTFLHLLTYVFGPRGPHPKMKLLFSDHSAIASGNLSLENLVSKIILGPTTAHNLNQMAVAKMLQEAKKDDLIPRIMSSTIPFRG